MFRFTRQIAPERYESKMLERYLLYPHRLILDSVHLLPNSSQRTMRSSRHYQYTGGSNFHLIQVCGQEEGERAPSSC
jgi:hypothetical protein